MTSIAEGHIIAGKYQLERPLAKGGMGMVWVARHLQLGTEVALKLMDPTLAHSADARGRFEREARATAMIKGPHVVTIHDYGVDGAVPYIAMELLVGEDLETRLARVGKLGVSATARLVAQVSRALLRAHEAGLVHRDLKPGNVFLARVDDDEVVKVLDFGIAKVLGLEEASGSTGTGMLLGSPQYMSPEQVRRSRRVDHRCDLWALGVIAFRCLTGSLPFEGDELGELLMEICTAAAPSPSTIEPTLSGDVDRFLARALARDPEARFQTARELAQACAALTAVEAPPAPLPPRRTSSDQPPVWARRRRPSSARRRGRRPTAAPRRRPAAPRRR